MKEQLALMLAPMRVGILFAILTIIFGFGLGAAFGGFEDDLKGTLTSSAKAVLATKYNGDEAEAKKVTDKSWAYFQRAHLHANGIATTAIALMVVLGFMAISPVMKSVISTCMGVGSLGYSLFWLLAGLRAPGMGSTGAAKESLNWLAQPSVILLVGGVLLMLVVFIHGAFIRKAPQGSERTA